jgi:hypothetical protein
VSFVLVEYVGSPARQRRRHMKSFSPFLARIACAFTPGAVALTASLLGACVTVVQTPLGTQAASPGADPAVGFTRSTLSAARTDVIVDVVLVNRHSGKCVTIEGASQSPGANIIQWTCEEGINSRWNVVPSSVAGYYQITSVMDGMCLDVWHASDANEQRLDTWPCKPTGSNDNQLWAVAQDPNGTHFKAKSSGKFMDVIGSSMDNGAQVQQYDGDGAPAQSFDIVATSTRVRPAPTASSLLLFSDNFASSALDPAKWWVNTSIPQGNARASVVNGAVVLENRAHLNTVARFDPYDGGLRVTGEWTFSSDADFLQIVTRSDGTPAGRYGETANGIVFGAYVAWGDLTQRIWISGNGTDAARASSAPLEMHPGDTFLFEIVDVPPNLFFRMTKKGAPERTASIRSASGYHPQTNLVTFHNREYVEGPHVALLRNVAIERVADPKELLDRSATE